MKNIVVVGSGVMGRGIAYVSALGGFSVRLVDVNENALKSAEGELNSIFAKGRERGKISAEQEQLAKANLSYASDLPQACSSADLIIEAVPEKAEIKKQVFETIEQFASEHCLFATNTSAMSPTEIASYGKRAERTIAMHFFNPVHRMPLVEIVHGLETSDETAETIKKVAEQRGEWTIAN